MCRRGSKSEKDAGQRHPNAIQGEYPERPGSKRLRVALVQGCRDGIEPERERDQHPERASEENAEHAFGRIVLKRSGEIGQANCGLLNQGNMRCRSPEQEFDFGRRSGFATRRRRDHCLLRP